MNEQFQDLFDEAFQPNQEEIHLQILDPNASQSMFSEEVSDEP